MVWDLHPGSYDRHLQRLRRERAEHDPPPLTRQRLQQLVAAITHDDDADRRLARHDLDLIDDAQYAPSSNPSTAAGTPTTRSTGPGRTSTSPASRRSTAGAA